jgi:phosphohistidine swiveling domain-containing protein
MDDPGSRVDSGARFRVNSMTSTKNSAMNSFILASASPLVDFELQGGGKAKNLAVMIQKNGIRVPDFFCIGDSAFQYYLDHHDLRSKLVPGQDLQQFSESVEHLFLSNELPADLSSAIESELKKWSGPVAVRSSGLEEDSVSNSFAGLFSSYLDQEGFQAVSRSIRLCFASAFSARALSYRIERGIPTQKFRMGVVVQRMVRADCAGVLFTRNPVKALDRQHAVIDSVFGLGEGLVSGEKDADHFVVNRDVTHSKFILESVKAPEHSQLSLSIEQLVELMQMGLKLESLYQGSPQDVEWAFEKGQLYLLQTRPITSLPIESFYNPAINGTNANLWDNSNIIESFSGVTSPFTFSFASNAYYHVYRQFAQMMNVPESVLLENDSKLRNMLGLMRGRIYYNLLHWYQLLMILPGAANNAQFMETMMGVKKTLSSDHQKIFDFMKTPPQYGFLLKLKLGLMSVARFVRADAIIADFKKNFNQAYEAARKTPYRSMSLPALLESYQALSNQVLRRWQAPIVNDFLCMIFFGWLKKLTQNWIEKGDAAASLQNDLLCGQGDLESTEPTKMLMRMAAAIDQGDAQVRTDFLTYNAKETWEKLKNSAVKSQVHLQILEYLDRYGFRCVNELKLEEPDLHDDPSFLVGILQSYVRMKTYSIEEMEKRERAMKDAAEAKVLKQVSGLRRVLYFWVLKQARKAVKTREDLRFDRTKIYGVIRHLIRAMGLQFTRLGKLDAEADVFYLTLDEITTFIEGRHPTNELRSLVHSRKKQFDVYRKTPSPPERFVTYGSVGMSLDYPGVLSDGDLLAELAPRSLDPSVLMGTSCCPGIVEGVVRVAHTFHDAENMTGEILVTSRTDPGWVPLYPSCSGLLIERGSLLSHSAVVARELGLPTIVGISGGLMSKLKTGQRVRMDAAKGEVKILGYPIPF